MKTITDVKNELEARKDRSAWSKGVTAYALELLENLKEYREYNNADEYLHPLELRAELLNGAQDWNQYSWGGSSLIYDFDIAERLCTPSELKRKKGGELNPNSREHWLDTQARALYQAAARIMNAARD
ncbi:MAG: hypothetical protein KH354_03900 [Clostridiales bacterium]|nr:hypothetical protein [Clostridiales bacterium]